MLSQVDIAADTDKCCTQEQAVKYKKHLAWHHKRCKQLTGTHDITMLVNSNLNVANCHTMLKTNA